MAEKKKKLKCYEVTMDSSVYAMSLVSDPAVELDFVYLSKEKPKHIFLEREDQHIIVGCALVPDKPIYRNYDGEEFYIQFSAKTIEEMAHRFMMSHSLSNFTAQHEDVIDDVTVVESWIKMGKGDKSANYGFDVPDGSWMIMCKVNNEDVWSQIKAGEMKGFSIEALVGLNEINLNKTEMAEQKETKLEAVEITDSFWDKLRGIIADALGKPQKSEEVEKTVGEVVDAMEVEGGPKDEEPKVVEQAEETPVETPAEEEKKPEEIAEEVVEKVEETSETPAEEAENLQAVIDELNAKIAEKDAEIEELKKQNQKLSKQPSTKPVTMATDQKTNPRDVIEALYNGSYFKKN